MGDPPPLRTVSHRLIQRPVGLLEEDDDRGWMVLRCSGFEDRAVGSTLAALGVPHLTLLQTVTLQYSRSRSRVRERGFLPGHWFVRWPAGRYDLFDRLRPLVVGMLTVPEGQGAVFMTELRDFCRVVLAGGVPTDAFCPGDEVEVCAGAMAGCRGRVLEGRDGWHLVVGLSVLGTCVRARIDPACLRRADLVAC